MALLRPGTGLVGRVSVPLQSRASSDGPQMAPRRHCPAWDRAGRQSQRRVSGMSVHQKYWYGANLQSRRCLMERRLELVEQNDVAQLAEHFNHQGPARPKELNLALQIAVLKKSDKYGPCVDLLLSYGACPDGTNGLGVPFVVVTAEAGCVHVLSSLLRAKCDPDQVREDGSSALHRATWLDHIECVQMLLDAGADTDLQDNQGRTPFLLAAQGDHIETMELLLKAGCDPAVPDKNGRTALYWAARYDNAEVMSFLLEEDEDIRNIIDMQDDAGHSALMVAAERGHLASTRVLLEYGANADLKNGASASALLLAARGQHVECACALLECKPDVNVSDDTGATPLIYLIHHSTAVYELLKAGADLEVRTLQGWTPTTLAASCDAYDSLKLLLRANCHFGSTDNSGPQRPTREAVVNGRLDNVKLLLHTAVLLGLDIQWIRDYLQEAYLAHLTRHSERIMAIYEWLRDRLGEACLVPTLTSLCRRCVRNSVAGCCFKHHIDCLPLPSALKVFLTLPELETIDLSQ